VFIVKEVHLNKRVVITGLGAITPIGLSAAEFWQGLVQGKCGIREVKLFDTTLFPVKLGGEVIDFDPGKYMPLKRADRNSRATQFAIAATGMAIEDAKLDLANEDRRRIGMVIATTGMPSIAIQYSETLKTRPLRIDPLITNRIDGAMMPIQVGLELGLQGPNTSVNSACASGSDALGTAMAHILLGNADVMLAGGAESQICALSFASMSLIGALSRNPDSLKACRPFDLERSGMILGEGAGMLVLESYEHAVRRGATILAELAGVGWSFDAYNDTAPNAETQSVAMLSAIKNAGISPTDIDYVNAHGTSTKLNDVTETQSLKLTLGARAYKVPVSSNKSMIGHLAAASGAVEAVASVLTIMHGIIPPTIGYQTPDPECDLDYVPNIARRQSVHACLSNSFGLGGQNCCVVIKAV
jgi:3-oxoacyl-[acyl-carrier-protein] synthase II